ncbi:unnamed protein product, partial [Rotaria magnacalcarata]
MPCPTPLVALASVGVSKLKARVKLPSGKIYRTVFRKLIFDVSVPVNDR